jgi:hypothetical protein
MKDKNMLTKKYKLLISIVLFFGISCSQYGEKLSFNGTDIYYKDGATINDAVILGEYFIKLGVTEDGEKRSYQIFKNGEVYVIRMIVLKSKENDKSLIEGIKSACSDLTENVFKVDKSKIEFHLCNDRFQTKRVVTCNSSYIPK